MTIIGVNRISMIFSNEDMVKAAEWLLLEFEGQLYRDRFLHERDGTPISRVAMEAAREEALKKLRGKLAL